MTIYRNADFKMQNAEYQVRVRLKDTDTLSFSLSLIQNVSVFTEEMLADLLQKTRLIITYDADGLPYWASDVAGMDITSYVNNLTYSLSAGDTEGTWNIELSGSFGLVDVVPEPSTATLSLLALAGLAARRRRK